MSAEGTIKSYRSRDLAIAASVGTTVLLASLLNFLSVERYPIFTPEVALLVSALVSIGVVMGILYGFAHRLLRAILDILLVLIALDINFDSWSALVVAAAIILILNRRLLVFVGITAAVVLLTELPKVTYFPSDTPLSPGGPAELAAGDNSLPPLVHLILDEHTGIEGLLIEPLSRALGDELRSFYTGHRFHVAGGAYSKSLYTGNSIPSLLNFGSTDVAIRQQVGQGLLVGRNRYFDLLRERGYAVNVYQTPFMDFCGSETVSSCWTNPPTLLLSIRSSKIASLDAAALLGLHFVRLSRAVQIVSRFEEPDLDFRPNLIWNYPTPVAGIQTLASVTDEVARLHRGTALFVHVLIPHRPFLFDSACRVKPLVDWSFDDDNLSQKEAKIAYDAQVRCLVSQLEPLIGAATSDTIIIIQGDHGSRITKFRPLSDTVGEFSDQDMIASFSTLFAVRAKDIAAGFDPRPLPIGLLLRQVVTTGFRSASPTLPAGFSHSVVLDNALNEPARVQDLPQDWSAN